MGYRERITEITGRLLAGETDRGAAAEELWALLAAAIERREWYWAKILVRHLAVIGEGMAAVESKAGEAMRVIDANTAGDPDAMLLMAMATQHGGGSGREEARLDLLLRARAIAEGEGSVDVVETIDLLLQKRK